MHSPATFQLRPFLKAHCNCDIPTFMNRPTTYGKIQKYIYHVGFELLMVVTMTSTVFWDVIWCSLVEICWHSTGTYCLHLYAWRVRHASNAMFFSFLYKRSADEKVYFIIVTDAILLFDPENWSTVFFRNVGELLMEYMVSHPTRYCS
jgi:hypothetical protein